MNLWTATSCLPLLAAAFALWYRRNAETRVPLTSPGKLEKDVSVPAWGAGDGAGRDEKICARASPVFFFAETVSDLAPGTGRPGGFGASDGGFGDVDGS